MKTGNRLENQHDDGEEGAIGRTTDWKAGFAQS